MNGRAWVFVVVILVLASGACGYESDSGEQVSFDTHDADPDWSPDGRWIAFATNRGRGGIYLIRADGTGMRPVFQGDARDPDWSPDGTSIAFAADRGIFVLDVASAKVRPVLRGAGLSLPAWSPNGIELAVVREEVGTFQTYNGSITDTSDAIYVVRLDGSHLRRLLPRFGNAIGDARPGSIAAVSETAPTWSPDGRRIAFEAGDGFVVSATIGNGRRHVIAAGGAYEPAWSPDGELIAYQCEGEVCVASADGSGDRRVLGSGGGDASWAPDSRQLVVEHYLYGLHLFADPQSLSLVNLDGESKRLTFGPETPG